MTAEQAWTTTLEQLQLQMTSATFNTWVKDDRMVKFEDDIFTIGVKSAYAKDWLENRLQGTIRRALNNTAGKSVNVNFVVLSSPQEQGALFMDANTRDSTDFDMPVNGHETNGQHGSASIGGMVKLRKITPLNALWSVPQTGWLTPPLWP